MKQVLIKNMYLKSSVELLYGMTLRGKQSRHRSKLVRILSERLKELGENELELIKEYTGVDEEGNPKRNEQGNFNIDDVFKFRKEQQELLEEEIVLEGEGNREMIKTVKEILFNYDEEIGGTEADTFNYLCEAFRVDEEEKQKAEEK
ncbi:hypothetical protein [Bacillus sp. mrc49]|uniref:hypothetical protein n=1 Tax=Bacillus sp. mrc49 TaxID=2054913 RepID=UPI000C277251|nr:hypothetical protein [Bacillus sp. mrc49]PJN90602.1 hypothetical protein CVN76_09400 [Bacillus sp. mrc49]